MILRLLKRMNMGNVAFLFVMLAAQLAFADKHVWTGTGSASTAGSWNPSGPPSTGDTVELSSGSNAMTWDVSGVSPACWNQTAGYTGIVTIGTRYSGGIDSLIITGDCTINGGRWRHTDNSTTQTYRLKAYIGGNFTLGSAGTINVLGLGYDAGNGPGHPTVPGGGNGGGGGGYGGRGLVSNNSKTYGSIIAPYHLGSGAYTGGRAGGGAIYLSVAGLSTINGIITSDGDANYNSIGGGSGGSIYLRSGTITGTTGRIRANGGNDGWSGSGGGGRIAVILTQSGADFASFVKDSIQAFGNTNGAYANIYSSAGTVYLQTYAQGTNGGELIIRDKMRRDNGYEYGYATTLNDSAAATVTVGSLTLKDSAAFEIGADDCLIIKGTGSRATIGANDSLVNKGSLLMDGTKVANSGVFIASTGAGLILDSLYLASSSMLALGGTTIYTRVLRVNTADQSNGTYTSANFPGQVSGSGSIVVGGGKIWNNGGGNNLATNGANWQGGSAPVTGDIVMLNSTSTANMYWDMPNTVKPGAWVQSVGYTGTVTIYAQYSGGLDTLQITGDATISGGSWTHRNNTTAETYRLCVKIGGNLSLGNGSTISANGLGFNADNGPGAPSPDGSVFGASYGGLGGATSNGATYGSPFLPVNIGSGGDQTKGGGAIILLVGGATTVSGTITANGSSGGAGSGSGGSIYLKAATIAGTGAIRANGGAGGGGTTTGGGGRIAIILTQAGADFSSLVQPIAYGGSAPDVPTDNEAAAGTVYLETQNDGAGNGQLIVDNNDTWVAGRVTTAIPAGQSWTIKKLKMANGGVLDAPSGTTLDISNCIFTGDATDRFEGIRMSGGNIVYPSGTFTIQNWSLLADTIDTINANVVMASGGYLTHTKNDGVGTWKMNLRIVGNVTVQSGGKIDVTAKGFGANAGPGKPLSASNAGSYGGMGGTDYTKSAPCYGTFNAPTDLGSGGSENNGNLMGGFAGGAIKLVITGTLTVGDSIKANGDYQTMFTSSGGSIYITAAAISGAGYITANGGQCGMGWGASGGGGRVALILSQSGNTFSGLTNTPQAFPGYNNEPYNHYWGGAGTVYLETANDGAGKGQLIIDDNSTGTAASGILTAIPSSATWSAKSVTVMNYAVLKIQSGTALTISGSGAGLLNINSVNAVLTNEGALTIGGTSVVNAGTFTSTAATSFAKYTGQSDNSDVSIYAAPYYKLAVEKSGTTFNLPSSNTTVTDSVKVLAGILKQSSGNLRAGGIAISPTAIFRNFSVGDDTIGAYGIANNGTLDLNSNAAWCGGNKDIFVRSSASGTARNWTGSGNFWLTDIDIKDQSAAAPVTAYNSTIANCNNITFAACTSSEGPPVVTAAPTDTTVYRGGTARFRAITSGARPVTWAWKKVGDATVIGTDSVLVLTNVLQSDSGSRYVCYATNTWDSDTSNQCLLNVTPVPFTVTINQSGGRDPTNALPVTFAVVFSEATTDFNATDITQAGSASGVQWSVTGSGTSYTATANPVAGDGTINPFIAAGAAHTTGADNLPNVRSTSTDSVVALDRALPSSTISSPAANKALRSSTWPGLSGAGTDPSPSCGIDSVRVLVRNTSKNLYWQGGTSWLASPKWVKASGKASWNAGLDTTMLKACGYGAYVDSSRSYDSAGNAQATATGSSFIFDITAPTGGITISGGGYTNDADPRLTITTSSTDSVRADSMRIDTITSSSKGFSAYAASDSVNIAGTGNQNGRKRVYTQFKDAAGNLSIWYSDSTIYDNVQPSCSVSTSGLFNGASWPGSIAGTARDTTAGIGAAGVALTIQNQTTLQYWTGSSWGTITSVSATVVGGSWSYSIPAASLDDAPYAVTAQATDRAGNVQATPSTGSFTYDNSFSGNGSLNIMDVNGFTNQPRVQVQISASAGITQMRVGKIMQGTQDTSTAAWKTLATMDSVNVRGDGAPHGVRIIVQFKDAAGNISFWTGDSTTYDSAAPTSQVATIGTFNAASWPTGGITGTTSDGGGSGVDSVYISIKNQNTGRYWNGAVWSTAAQDLWIPATLTLLNWSYPIDAAALGDSRYTIHVKAVDKVKNAEGPPAAGTFTYDNTAPVVTAASIEVLDKSGFTADADPPLRLTVTGADSMRIGVDTAGAYWKPYAGSDSVLISSGSEGRKFILAQFKDTVGNLSIWVHDSTVYDRSAPTSSVSTNGQFNAASWIGKVTGSAYDQYSGIDSVSVSLQNQTTSLYWNGAAWSSGQTWNRAVWNDTNWSYAIPATELGSATYGVSCRAVDRAGNRQTSPAQGSFSYYVKPTAKFGPAAPVSAPASVPVVFSDSSTGVISKWTWSFGDGTGDTTRNPSHAYQSADTGKTFSVKLIVQGPGGVDSMVRQDLILVVSPFGNPVRITGRYLSPTRVQITYTGYEQIRTTDIGFPPRHIDSLRLYLEPNKIPASAATSSLIKGYAVSTLKQATGQYIDTVIVPAPGVYDTNYGFLTAAHWTDGSLGDFRDANGYLVLMADTMKPLNRLALSGGYIGHDSARVYIDSLRMLDTAVAASVGIWYGLTQNTDFTSASVIWLAAPAVITGASAGRYPVIIKDPVINRETQTLYVRSIIRGKNGLYSMDTAKTAFSVGRPRPANPVVLHTKVLDASRIRLTWNNVPSSVDSIRIWYGTDTVPHDWSIPATRFTALRPAAFDTLDTAVGLNEMTRYDFGLQIFMDGLWSRVTVQSSASDSTPRADTGTIVNSIVIRGATFDTAANTITIRWRLPSDDVNNRDFGITYGLGSFSLAAPQQWQQARDTLNTSVIDLKETVVFDTLYCISMLLRKPGGQSSGNGDSSRVTVHSPGYTWQQISYFAPDVDTVWAFNNHVAIWKDSLYVSSDVRTDTIRAVLRADTIAGGMVMTGVGFRFADTPSIPPIHIGLIYMPSQVPTGYSASEIRMYRLKDGKLYVERGVTIDTIAHLLSIRTDQLADAFVLMIDTVAPRAISRAGSMPAIDPSITATIIDTFDISDNIANVKWTLLSANGGEGFAGADTGTLSGNGEVAMAIASSGIWQNGRRIYLIIDDGVHIDTLDISRQGIRDKSDPMTVAMEDWCPLHVTATLDSPELASIFGRYLAPDGSAWTYNMKKERFFRYYETPSNAIKADKWVEYGGAYDSLFAFMPGCVIWGKTRERLSIDFGRATTLRLQDTFALDLRPGWTDFSLPYMFDMKLKDVLNASDSAAELVQVHGWKKDAWRGSDSVYVTEVVYVNPGVTDNRNSATLSSASDASYTVYNPRDSVLRLRFPAVPVALSPAAGRPKVSAGSWSIRVRAGTREGRALGSVFCGYLPEGRGVSYSPLPPSFSSIRAGVYDRGAHKVRGGAIAHGLENQGVAYELVFVNGAEQSAAIEYVLESMGASLPPGMQAMVFDPSARTWESDSLHTTQVGGGNQAYRWLVVGDAKYRSWFETRLPVLRLAMLGLYPNPVRRQMTISYMVPYTGARDVRFTIYDMLGRMVWRYDAPSEHPGVYRVVWDPHAGKNGAGAYIVRMTAIDGQTGTARTFKQRITVMR